MGQFVAIIADPSSEETYNCMVQKIYPQFIVVIQKLKGKNAIWRNSEKTIDVPSAVLWSAQKWEWIL